MKKQQNTISKPKPFFAPGSESISKKELEDRQLKYKRLEKIGEKPTIVTGNSLSEGEVENPYRVKAMVLINEGKDVPEELIKQIKEYDKKLLEDAN